MNYKWEPNKNQRAAIEAPTEGALRLISGPGSGKTFVQVHRYAYLVEQGVDPTGIMLVVFNRRNADEMADRVKELVPQAATDWITTIHAACFTIFREDKEAFPGGNKYRVVEHEAQWFKHEKFSIKSHIQSMAEDLWPNPDYRPGWKEIWTVIANSKMRGLTPQESGSFFNEAVGEHHGEKIYRIYIELWAKMKALKLLTFGDMLLLVDVQLRRDSAFRGRWQQQFTHVLVDEAQDVSEQAMRILTTLAAPQNNFFAVGDQDQLLYRFTGATPEINLMDGFEQKYPDGATVMMGVNYRSDNSRVIDRAQKLIAFNYADEGGPYEQRYMKDLEAKSGAGEGAEFVVTAHQTPEIEAEAVADSIAAMLAPQDDGGFLTAGINPGQVFVGARTRAQLGYLEGPLLRREVPFINITGGSFWESKHVADVIAYVRLAHDTNDRDAFQRVFNIGSNWMTVPWKKSPHYGEYCNHRYLGAAFLRDCRESWDGMRYAVSGRDGWRYRTGVDDLESFVYELQGRLSEGPQAAIQFVLDNCYIKWIQADEGLTAGDEAENGKLEDLRTVTEIAGQHETVGEFLTYVAECVKAAEAARNGEWDEYVILSTVHRLKGLERDVVFGIGWGEGYVDTKDGPEPRGLLPHTFSLMPPPQHGILPIGGMGRVEDERCLAFVLITRARQEVYLSYPVEYRGATFGPSRFLVEMGLVEDAGPEPEGPEGELTEAEYLEREGFDNGVIVEESGEGEGGDALPAADDGVSYPWGEMTDEEIDTALALEDLAHKAEFAKREAEQERAAFESDPDYRRSLQDVLEEHKITTLRDGRTSVLGLFPERGRFEDNIYRPSAHELAAALPDYTPTIEGTQLVLEKDLGGGSTVVVYTTVHVGEIAQGTGEDSIRVTRRDVSDRGTFWFKDAALYVNRRVPADARTNEAAAAHIAAKVEANVAKFTRPCPECGKTQVKCKAGSGRDVRYWWKGLECRCKVSDGW